MDMPEVESKPVAKKTASTKVEEIKEAKKRAEKTAMPPLDFSQIKVRTATKDDVIAHRRSKGTRDPEQVASDNLVRRAYDKWIEAGRPTDWLGSENAGFHIRLPEGQYETFEKRVRNSGQHYALAVRFGERRDSDGFAEVVLVVKDRPKNDKVEEESVTKDDAAEA